MEPVPFLHDLGHRVATRWLAHDHDEAVFAEIATSALQEAEVWSHVSPDALIRWLLRQDTLVRQIDEAGTFGQPPLTLYAGRGFGIDVYWWLDGTTSVHRHSFSGAFCVLSGSSVHARYRWTLTERVNSGLLLGETAIQDVEVLGPGAVRPILAGGALLHSLFHLDHPSVSLVVRTLHEADATPQYSHLPYAAVDRSRKSVLVARQLAVLELLWKTRRESWAEAAVDLLRRVDFPTSFSVIESTASYVNEPADLDPLLRCTDARHGRRAEVLRLLAADVRRSAALVAMRETTEDPDERFFLALLLALPDRRSIDAAIRGRFRGDPAIRIVGWVDALGPRLLGMPLDDSTRAAIHLLLRGMSDDRVVDAFRLTYGNEAVDREADLLVDLCAALRANPVLRPLFLFPSE